MNDTKNCPYCAEEIKAAAIVCKHCGREMPEFEERQPRQEKIARAASPQATSTQPPIWKTASKAGAIATAIYVIGKFAGVNQTGTGPEFVGSITAGSLGVFIFISLISAGVIAIRRMKWRESITIYGGILLISAAIWFGFISDNSLLQSSEQLAKSNNPATKFQTSIPTIDSSVQTATAKYNILGVTPDSSRIPIQWELAKINIGKGLVVCGPVVNTNYAASSPGSPTFLDIGLAYPDPNRVSIVIWGENKRNFSNDNIVPETLYDGKAICVFGLIENYDGVVSIELVFPSQISITRQLQTARPKATATTPPEDRFVYIENPCSFDVFLSMTYIKIPSGTTKKIRPTMLGYVAYQIPGEEGFHKLGFDSWGVTLRIPCY